MSDLENYVVIHRVELSEDEAKNAVVPGINLPDIMRRRGSVCFLAAKESEFMAVANLQRLPAPPEMKSDGAQ